MYVVRSEMSCTPLDSHERSRVLMFSSEIFDRTLHLSFPAIMTGDRFGCACKGAFRW